MSVKNDGIKTMAQNPIKMNAKQLHQPRPQRHVRQGGRRRSNGNAGKVGERNGSNCSNNGDNEKNDWPSRRGSPVSVTCNLACMANIPHVKKPSSSEDSAVIRSFPPLRAISRRVSWYDTSTRLNSFDIYGDCSGYDSKQRTSSVVVVPGFQQPKRQDVAEPRDSSFRYIDAKLQETPLSISLPKQIQQPIINVISLAWDHDGIPGQFTGEVNSMIRPHGSGTLLLDDGTYISSTWCNGTLVCENNDTRDSSVSLRRPIQRRRQLKMTKLPTTIIIQASKSKDTTERSSLPGYILGGDMKTHQDMIVEKNRKKAIQNANNLHVHDFAFVLRSGKSKRWTYAIVADISPCNRITNINGNYEDGDATIRFVVNDRGSTKKIPMKHWGKLIRLVNRSPSKNVTTPGLTTTAPCTMDEGACDIVGSSYLMNKQLSIISELTVNTAAAIAPVVSSSRPPAEEMFHPSSFSSALRTISLKQKKKQECTTDVHKRHRRYYEISDAALYAIR